eukprot:INCI13421.2.p1 GENE.INCI13421.2~~INCI13421.2.p1  ORF type:complete len:965 (-),score=224.34 INCI13421.2:3147-5672(-)
MPRMKKTRASAASQLGRSRTPDRSEKNALNLAASDTDSEWVPLRESKDFNAQLHNCYEGLNALQVRCGYINKKLSLKAQQITLSLKTRAEAVKQQLSLGASRRREIDDEIKALQDDSPVEQDLQDVLHPLVKELEEAEAAKRKHDAAVEQAEKKRKKKDLEKLAEETPAVEAAVAEKRDALQRCRDTHAEMVKTYSDQIRLLQVEQRFSAQNEQSLLRERDFLAEETRLKSRQLSRVHRGRDVVQASITALKETLDRTLPRIAALENKKMAVEEEWQRAIHRLSKVENVVQLQHVQREVRTEIAPLPGRHAWLDELLEREKSRVASLVLAIHECFSAESRRLQFETSEFDERVVLADSLRAQLEEERSTTDELLTAFETKSAKLKRIYKTRQATMALNKKAVVASIEGHLAAKPVAPPIPDFAALDKAAEKAQRNKPKKKDGEESDEEENEAQKARKEFAEQMAKFEQEQAKWVEKMNVLNSRSAATDKVLEELQELEKATPDAESMPDSLLLEKESITQQAANRVSEFAELWKKTASRSNAHIRMSTKEDVGVSRTLQEVLITGLQVDVDGEVFEKDTLAVRNAALHSENHAQKKDFESKIESLEVKTKRVIEANEEQLEALEEMNSGSIEYLKAAIAKQKKSFEDERKAWALQMQEQKDDFEGRISLLKGKLKRAEGVSERRLNWISSLQKDLDQEKGVESGWCLMLFLRHLPLVAVVLEVVLMPNVVARNLSSTVKMKEYRDRTTAEIQHRAQLVSDLKQELGQADDLAAKRLNVMDALRAKVVDSCLQLKTAQKNFEEEMEDMRGHMHKAKHELYRRDEVPLLCIFSRRCSFLRPAL